MSEPQGDDLVRTETFEVAGPLDLDISVTLGRIDIELTDTAEATVEVRHAPDIRESWAQGVTNLLNWVNERFGEQFGGELRGSPVEAVQQTRVELTGRRLAVRAPKPLPLRNIPLAVTVRAPAGSGLEIRAGSADVNVTGACGRVDVLTGSGEVKLDRAEGAAQVRTGSGAIRLGPTLAGLQLRTGSGDVEASSLAGSVTLVTGTGDVWLGAAAGEIMARSGSGDLSVAEAASGSLELITGSGEIRVGVRPGVTAEVDLTSGSGKVSSELDVETEAPEGEVPLKIRARTGVGSAVLTRATQ
ncbi:hypothetical protein FHX82_002536 [Amycolatopsis bartoniae]|uniref:DUF4097 domain-containing protein n=1 Tax=Amycolatopsis bartoniae TaxID=941986 RepID=A0A8H9IWR9_9PSEU|nr:DUF4097 family beta strand repeat-containing protein [Amycolatopsis bartoniae]MBB2935482.1 hypothetical protein [Amycolatopsis bartoniae]TVT04493.1 DUF4097 domain-containing protein [Amycolatopsis bartoniae]GHF76308.1 hypothetical protein GCM10017566_57890 [Amycolatopsis bartoniae]